MIPYILTENSVTVIINFIPKVIDRSYQYFDSIVEALKVGDDETVKSLIDVANTLAKESSNALEVKNGAIFYKGEEIHNYLVEKILTMKGEGFNIQPMLKFLENLLQNPSYRSREQLYKFLEASNMPITDDGHFVAYKKVGEDYKDLYTGKMDNSIGAVVEMPRENVDDDPTRTCSAGLHFAAYEYMNAYGTRDSNKVVVVKINPRDVVSIPIDYKNQKGRCCRYEVIGEIENWKEGDKLAKYTVYETKKETTPKEEKCVGVSFEKRRKLWKASAKYLSRTYHIGYYKNKEDACRAAKTARQALASSEFFEWLKAWREGK